MREDMAQEMIDMVTETIDMEVAMKDMDRQIVVAMTDMVIVVMVEVGRDMVVSEVAEIDIAETEEVMVVTGVAMAVVVVTRIAMMTEVFSNHSYHYFSY